MTLLLQIAWSEPGTTVRIVDTAAHTTVGEGRASHPASDGDRSDTGAWWTATVDAARLAVDAAAALGQDPSELRAVVLEAADPPGGLVALDGDGGVLCAVTGSHTASDADAGWLVSHTDGGAEAWTAATGVEPTGGSTAALLSWLHRSDAEAWGAAERFTLPTGWLLERLGGDAALGPHDAVGTAVLERRSARSWCTDLLEVVDDGRDWSRALPRVVPEADPVGMLSAEAAEQLGVRAGLPLHLGGAPAPDQPS